MNRQGFARLPGRRLAGAVVIALVFAAALGAFLGSSRRVTVRSLHELGDIAIPGRLDPYSPDELDGYSLFPFDRTSNSILMMGSNRPVMEGLVVGVWDADHRGVAHEAVKGRVRDRTDGIAWHTEGAWEIGEGVHEVNTTSHPAVVVVRDVSAHNLTVGYFAWSKVSSVLDAQRIVDAAIASYQPKTDVDAYLKIAADRPRKLAAARRAQLQSRFKSRGIDVALGGEIVEHDGTFYEYAPDERYAEVVLAVCPLGTLRNARQFRQLHPPTTTQVSYWPDAVWFQWDGDAWTPTGDVTISATMRKRLDARHVDTTLAYVYAATWEFPADPSAVEFRLDAFWEALASMKTLFDAREIVVPVE